MSLRIKITLALVLTNLLASLTVGGVAEWVLRRDFRETVLEEAFRNFRSDVKAYIRTHGSLQAAIDEEPFNHFVMRRRNVKQPDYDPKLSYGESLQTVDEEGIVDRRDHPPFGFLLFSPSGDVLFEITGFQKGETVSSFVRKKSKPVVYEGKTVAYAYPVGEPRLTDRDLSYFSAIRQALIAGVVLAMIFSLATGLIFAGRLSGALSRLSDSLGKFGSVIEKTDMTLDLASFKIPEETFKKGDDEIAKLAHTFNVMIERSVRAHSRLKHESERDPLTSLFNRRYFDQRSSLLFELSEETGQFLSLILMDVDHFKRVNDDFSHEMGDTVLKTVSHILDHGIRKGDLLARYGGEEFVVLLPGYDLESAVQAAERLRTMVESHPWSEIHERLSITISGGVSAARELGSIGKMMVDADRYLYEAKRAGRNRILFTGHGREKKRSFSLFRRITDRLESGYGK